MRGLFLSLRSQLVVLIILALVVAQIINLVLFVDERSLAIRAALGFEAAGRAANVARLIEEAPPELHPSILRAAASPLIRFSMDPKPAVALSGHAEGGRVAQHIRRLLDDDFSREIRVELREIERRIMPLPHLSDEMARMHHAMMRGELSAIEMNLSIAISGGRWLNVGTRFERPPLQWPLFSAISFGVTTAVVLVALFWFLVTRLTGPLLRLSRAADRFGRGEDVAPLPAKGPQEVRDLTVAFNLMRERLTRFVADRTRILAAVSHDLRSPLTALRVRVEMVEDDETRESLTNSIEEMQRMTEATLTFAKGVTGTEPQQTVEIGALLAETAAEEQAEVRLEPGRPVHIRLRPAAMKRALRNLIGNSVRYGGAPRIAWVSEGSNLMITIADDGPGIPEDELERVFDPFYRLEDSRSPETGGHGLGLSIARSILRSHGGDVVLANLREGGLVATITLPMDPDAAEQDQAMKSEEHHERPGDHDPGGAVDATGRGHSSDGGLEREI